MSNNLLKELKEQDYKDKKETINQIDTFKAIYKKTSSIKVKEIINALMEELEEINSRIIKIEKVIKSE